MKKWPLRAIYYLTGFLMLSSLHCMIVGMVSGGSLQTFLHTLVYLPVIILLSEGQKRTKYAWQFLICVAAAMILTRAAMAQIISVGAMEVALATILTTGAAFLYFYARAKKTECFLEAPEYYFLGLYLIMWFLERQYPSELLEKYAVIGAGSYCLLCMYKTNMDEILQFIDLNEKLERFPEKRLLKSNLLMMGFQTLVVGCGMGIALSTGADGLFDKIVQMIRRFFAWLLSFLESDAEHVGSEISGGAAIMPVVETEEPSAFMELLLKILDVLSWVIVIGLTLFVLYKIVKKFYQLYLEFDVNSVENGDEIEKIYTQQTKEEKRRLRKSRSENLRWDRSPNARIRKYYKKRVLGELKDGVKSAMTPEEIGKQMKISGDERKLFCDIYERARYSGQECQREDAEKIMKI